MTKITSLKQLCEAALNKKAVVVPSRYCFSKPMPAAFMQNMQAVRVNYLLEAGVWIYEPKGRK